MSWNSNLSCEYRIRAILSDRHWNPSIRLMAMNRRNNELFVGKLVYEDKPHPDSLEVPSAMNLSMDMAQELMDSLWECGVRPKEGQGSAGQMESVKYHLEDMRKLVFKGK